MAESYNPDGYNPEGYHPEGYHPGGGGDGGGAGGGTVVVGGRRPTTKRTSARAVVMALDGRERPYPVYRFSGRHFHERPNHNPFKDA